MRSVYAIVIVVSVVVGGALNALWATIRMVPEQYPAGINAAIAAAQDGDVISVWGPPPGQPLYPPYHYYENVNFNNKNLVVASRCFLPGWTGCTPTYDSVVINGQQLGSVVTMAGSEDDVLEGFTIRNGSASGYGGGVICNEGSILNNHILDNFAELGGGGLFFGNYAGACWIHDNLIEDNSTSGYGGGILVHARGCSIRRDTVRNNTASNRGGGINLVFQSEDGGSLTPPPDDSVTDNVVVGNHLTTSDALGGGILAWGYPMAARRNVVMDNDSNGVYVYFPLVGGGGSPTDLGDAGDPGFNILMGNDSHDLVVEFATEPITQIHAVGNYWGYLDTHTIRGRILSDPPNDVLFDPVAASSKWFDVDLEPLSTCSTGVLVTGDLQVTRSLTIVEGETLVFYHTPDTPLSSLTDLVVSGSGTVLTSAGTAENMIEYVPQRVDPLGLDYWYGVRVLAPADAQFSGSEVRRAYWGIDVGPGGSAEVTDSRLDSCLYAGASCQSGALDVELSNVSYNGVYGVRYQTDNTLHHCGVAQCTLNYNGIAGVSIVGPGTSNVLAPNQISANLIDGGGITLHGIEAADNASWTSIGNNQVTGCDQAGIAITSSAPGLDGNQVSGCNMSGIELTSCSPTLRVQNNTVQNNNEGIACIDGSSPKVRGNLVSQHICGVYCDQTSAPDLGTVEDPGMNSILMDNYYWVVKLANPLYPDSVMAQLNWWGTDDVNSYGGKFQGHVDSFPWLHGPPQDGGQQSAGAVSLRLVTGLDRLQPMPMRSTARIPFQVARAGQVALSIVDVSGRLVRTLVRGERGAGRYNPTWNRTDDRGRRVAAGVYFCTLDAEKRHFCRKVVLTK
ncbi:MAG TPA: right-handed parallel beta-helix repeat-containing protein [bacterium]|nr:right-handed parallel beta-helix repeat-containing protein [bacterium]